MTEARDLCLAFDDARRAHEAAKEASYASLLRVANAAKMSRMVPESHNAQAGLDAALQALAINEAHERECWTDRCKAVDKMERTE